MSEEKRRRRRRRSKERPNPFPIGYTVWSIFYSVIFIVIFILPTVFTMNRLLNNLTLFYHYIFIFFVILHLGLAVISRKSRLVLALLTAALTVAYTSPAVRDLMLNSEPNTAQARALKVVTYNWLASNTEFETFHEWVRVQRPDIIAIEEKPGVLAERYNEIQAQYPYSTETKGDDDVILLSHYPIISERTFRVARRPVVEVRVSTPSGTVKVYALHSQTVTSQSLWELKNEYLVTADAVVETNEPTVVMGDFNATRWDPVYRGLVAKNELHAQPYLFPPVTRVLGSIAGVSYGSPIDHVLASEGVQLKSCRTAPAMGSDHVPVICDITY